MLRDITQSIVVEAPPDEVFRNLITPSDIRGWWGASSAIVLAQPFGYWAAQWGDDDTPDFITVAKISTYRPPIQLTLSEYTYFARTGSLPFDADFETRFEIATRGTGSRLTVQQTGFPKSPQADEFYQECVRGWENTLDSLQKWLMRPQ